MTEPPTWTGAELASDAETANEAFRTRRLREPLVLHSRFFRSFVPVVADIIDRLPSLASGATLGAEAAAHAIGDDELRAAFRYLAAPPVSEDDLKTLAEAHPPATAPHTDDEEARRAHDTVLQVIDPHRFAWFAEGRSPTEPERLRAIISSAALIATRKVETARHAAAKTQQRLAVKDTLLRAGLVEVRAEEIANPDTAPKPGEFCGRCSLGGTHADWIVRLADGRVAAIECKESNSAVSSRKRIDHEALGKARIWLEAFGGQQVVPVAVIDGVFNPKHLVVAQSGGLTIIWCHRLDDLAQLVVAGP